MDLKMSETRYRVTNKCRYDIGVRLSNGQEIVITPDSFQLLTADDIAYIDSICFDDKFFSKRMLVPYDQNGKEVPMDQLGMYIEEDPVPHLDDAEITAALKQTPKKIEAWLSQIEDPAELHAIFEVAQTMDLPASKLKLLITKMPEKDLLG